MKRKVPKQHKAAYHLWTSADVLTSADLIPGGTKRKRGT